VTKFLLSVHVLAVILAIGPVAVAASMFPPAARAALAVPGDGRTVAIVRTLHRICRGYALVGIVVPVFGLATAASLGVLTEAWLIISIILTAAAAAVLVTLLLPAQTAVLAQLDTTPSAEPPRRTTSRLAMYAGLFNVLWVTITILMIVRPGSTTGT
jgi:hypothetical protein